MRHLLLILGLSCIWANQATAQPAKPGNADKMVRVTYPVADLVIRVENHSVFHKVKSDAGKSPEELAQTLMKLLTETVARDSWDGYGGEGRIQYFPMGMAIVVNQRQDVQDAIAKLLADLRRPQDTQIALELRLIKTSAGLAERMRADLLTVGQPVRALEIHKVGPIGRFTSLDDKQVFALLSTVQGDRVAHIIQAPKLTIYNGQQAGIMSFMEQPHGKRGLGCDVWAVADAQKNVRVAMDLEFADPDRKQAPTLRVAGTFMLPSDRTLIWHLGDSTGEHVWVLLTPRVIVVEEETPVLKKIEGSSGWKLTPVKVEDLSIPGGLTASKANESALKDPKERAIEHRLRQPITLSLKDRPLREAIKDIAAISGIQVVLDTAELHAACIDLDMPLSVNVEEIDMKYALKILLAPKLTYVIEDQVLKITSYTRLQARLTQIIHPIGDLLMEMNPIDRKSNDEAKELLIWLIRYAVAPRSWDTAGNAGRIQYLSSERALKITQSEEVHEEIQQLLTSLRRLNELTVQVDVRFVHASKELARRWSKIIGEQADFVMIDDACCEKLLQDAKDDRGAKVMQLPRLPVLNGQTVKPQCARKIRAATDFKTEIVQGTLGTEAERTESGWRCEVKPTVSPDRESVHTALTLEHFTNDEFTMRSLKTAREFPIPDGGTLLWHVGDNGGQSLFVLVTTRVQVRQQEERLQIPGR